MAHTAPALITQGAVLLSGDRAYLLASPPGTSQSETIKAPNLDHHEILLVVIGGPETDENLQAWLLASLGKRAYQLLH